jgi:hypothetical protein
MATQTLLTPGENAVLDRIRRSPLKPTDLLVELRPVYSYTEIQGAISDLLETGNIILTSNRHLEPARPAKED